MFAVLPAPKKDEGLSLSKTLQVGEVRVEKASEEKTKVDAESQNSSEEDEIVTNVTEIKADDLVNKDNYYAGQLRNHSLTMFKKQTLERNKDNLLLS